MPTQHALDCCATITAMLHGVPSCCPRHNRNDPRAMSISTCIAAYLRHGEMPGRDILPCGEMEDFFYDLLLPKLQASCETSQEVTTVLRTLIAER